MLSEVHKKILDLVWRSLFFHIPRVRWQEKALRELKPIKSVSIFAMSSD